MSTFNIADLKKLGTETKTEKEAVKFIADTLRCVITDEAGAVVIDCMLEPRGFAAKENKKTNKTVGGFGWYGAPSGESCGEYNGVPVNAGLRISVDGVKVAPDTAVPDMRTVRHGEPEDGAEDGEDS